MRLVTVLSDASTIFIIDTEPTSPTLLMATPLPHLTLHPGTYRDHVDAVEVVEKWLGSLEEKLRAEDFPSNGTHEMFIEDCWWRDIVALKWD